MDLKPRVPKTTKSATAPPAGIAFKHPGYAEDDVLFTLPRLDSSSAQTEDRAATGVHHGTALLACQIIANNAFDGYLATDRDGQDRVSISYDGILLEEEYWFHAEGGDDAAGIYPVVPRFEEWRFPHGCLHMESLTAWDPKSQTAESQVRPVDRSTSATTAATPSSMPPPPTPSFIPRCILSDKPYGIQTAHLVPVAQSQWFQENTMKRYGDLNNRLFIHTARNKVSISHHLHKLWDDYVFALVPKLTHAEGSTFVVHVLNIPNLAVSEFASEWHNTPVQEGALGGAGQAFLFAKFAQAVFMLFKPFVAFSATPRYLATLQATAEDNPQPPLATKRWFSVAALSKQYSGGGSRSASVSVGSRKRSRSQTTGHEEDDDWYETNVAGHQSDEDEDDWYERNVARHQSDEEERGRPRKRRQRRRSEHTVDTLPSLTDTSADGGDLEDIGHSGILPTTGPLGIHASKDATVGQDAAVADDVPPSVGNAT